MAIDKERYIGESLIKAKPKKKLAFLLGDGVVTTPKIKDGAVTHEKLQDEAVTISKLADEIMEDLIIPTIDEKEGPIIGQQAAQSAVLNGLQETLNEIYAHLPNGVIVEGSISQFEYGTSAEVTITAYTSNENVADFTIRKNGVAVQRFADTNKIEYTETLTENAVYEVSAEQEGYVYKGSWSVATVYPFYGGGGAEYSDVLTEEHKLGATTDINGKYSLTLGDNDRIFFIVPSGIVADSIRMSGFDIPMEDVYTVINGMEYKVYESSNTYSAGTYDIQIGSYQGDEADMIEAILNMLNRDKEEYNADGTSKDRVIIVSSGSVYGDLSYEELAKIFSKEDAVYRIADSIDLQGNVLNVPANSSLDFVGGDFRNGSIVLDNTYIKGDAEGFKGDAAVSGSISNDKVQSSWFEMPKDDVHRQFAEIASISSASGKPIDVAKGDYTLLSNGKYDIEFTESVDFNGSTLTLDTNGYGEFILFVRPAKLVEIPQSDFAGLKDLINRRLTTNSALAKYRNSFVTVNSDAVEFQRYQAVLPEPIKQKEIFYVDENGYRTNDIFNDKGTFDDVSSANYFDCSKTLYFRNVTIKLNDDTATDGKSGHRGFRFENCANITVENVLYKEYRSKTVGMYFLLTFSNCYNVTINNANLTTSYVDSGAAYTILYNNIIKTKWSNVVIGDIENRKWPPVGSNYIVDWTVEDSYIGSLGIHYRINNLYFVNTTIGRPVPYNGFGMLEFHKCRFISNDIFYIGEEYGSFFDGTIALRDCEWLSETPGALFALDFRDFDFRPSAVERFKSVVARNITIEDLYIPNNTNTEYRLFSVNSKNTSDSALPEEAKCRPYPRIKIKGVYAKSPMKLLVMGNQFVGYDGVTPFYSTGLDLTLEDIDFPEGTVQSKRPILQAGFAANTQELEDLYSVISADSFPSGRLRAINCRNIPAFGIFANFDSVYDNCTVTYIDNTRYTEFGGEKHVHTTPATSRIVLKNCIIAPYATASAGVNYSGAAKCYMMNCLLSLQFDDSLEADYTAIKNFYKRTVDGNGNVYYFANSSNLIAQGVMIDDKVAGMYDLDAVQYTGEKVRTIYDIQREQTT